MQTEHHSITKLEMKCSPGKHKQTEVLEMIVRKHCYLFPWTTTRGSLFSQLRQTPENRHQQFNSALRGTPKGVWLELIASGLVCGEPPSPDLREKNWNGESLQSLLSVHSVSGRVGHNSERDAIELAKLLSQSKLVLSSEFQLINTVYK